MKNVTFLMRQWSGLGWMSEWNGMDGWMVGGGCLVVRVKIGIFRYRV